MNPELIVFNGDMIDAQTIHYGPLLEILEELPDMATYAASRGSINSGPVCKISCSRTSWPKASRICQSGINCLFLDEYVKIVGLYGPADQRTECFCQFYSFAFGLVCAGHAQGEQFRVPGPGPLIAPDQRLFPLCTHGPCAWADTTMIVNRGLGNSIVPKRINNPPEIVDITMTAAPCSKNPIQSVHATFQHIW